MPRLAKHEARKTELIGVRVTIEDRRRIEAAARDRGLSTSDWLRALIDREVARAARRRGGAA